MKTFANYSHTAKAVAFLFGIKRRLLGIPMLALGVLATLFFAVGLNSAAARVDPLANTHNDSINRGGQVQPAEIPCAFCVDPN